MFENKRYISRGVNDEIPLVLQLLMWQMIDDLKKTKKQMDYLQVFELEFDDKRLMIYHHSEKPRYSRKYEFHVGTAENKDTTKRKVYVIDDGVCTTMVYPEER